MESRLELELAGVLPGVEADDRCLARLETALQGHRGLRRAHVERERRPPALALYYDPDTLSLADVRAVVERAGARLRRRFQHDLLPIEGMDCSDCSTVIEHSVGRLGGVMTVRVSYAAETMRVEYDAQAVSRAAIERRVRALGYAVPAGRVRTWVGEHGELLRNVAAAALLFAAWVGSRFLGVPPWAAVTVYVASYIAGGWDVARHAFATLRAGSFDTNVLMVAAALGAAGLGEPAEGALLLVLYGLGHALEEAVLDRARAAIRALGALTPKTAVRLSNGSEMEIPVADLDLDDVVVVRPGVRVPVDGVVLRGRAAVDQAPVTGESMPVDKGPGEKVFAGSVNGDGALEVRVTRLSKDSTMARVARMVEDAQTQKSPTQRLVERFERRFVPAALSLAVLVAVIPVLLGWPLVESFGRGLTLLVAASPCALALGTPAALLAGIAQAARHGVLIKGGVHLENLGRVTAMAFDKTGTLTHGRPQVTDVVAFAEAGGASGSGDSVLAQAAAIESRSGHPLAKAVVQAAAERGLAMPTAGLVESETGRGLRANLDGRTVLVGNDRLLDGHGVPVPADARREIERLQREGKTVMRVAVDARLVGVIAVADTLRPGVPDVMQALATLGVRERVMLTGDHFTVAVAIAERASVARVEADLMPEQKLAVIRELAARFAAVAMVGDGVNDAPALASATVGIAMGGAGTDVALETADVALIGDDLTKLPFAVELGRATRRVVAQNLAIALGVIVLLVSGALGGVLGVAGAVALHEGSTVVVAANALRLLRRAAAA